MGECPLRWPVLIQRRLETTLCQLPDALLRQAAIALEGFRVAAHRGTLSRPVGGASPAGTRVPGQEATGYRNVRYEDVRNWRIAFAVEDARQAVIVVDILPLMELENGTAA